jgi:hypothetical protein
MPSRLYNLEPSNDDRVTVSAILTLIPISEVRRTLGQRKED